MVKVINKKNKVIKEVPENIAGDYLGTGEYDLVKEDKKETPNQKPSNINVNNNNNNR